MPGLRTLSDQELIDVAHQWRRLSLSGSSEALREATRHEAEVRRRLGEVDPNNLLAAAAKNQTQSETVEPLTIATATSEFIIATADVATQSAQALRDLLRNLRVLLDMNIAFVAEFVEGRKVYRHIDHALDSEVSVQSGDSAPLEVTLCQRVVDGRLPEHLADTRSRPEMKDLAAVKAMNIGAYLSTPVVLKDGSIYGTLCCISHAPRSALGSKQVDALRYVAGIIAKELEKRRS